MCMGILSTWTSAQQKKELDPNYNYIDGFEPHPDARNLTRVLGRASALNH